MADQLLKKQINGGVKMSQKDFILYLGRQRRIQLFWNLGALLIGVMITLLTGSFLLSQQPANALSSGNTDSSNSYKLYADAYTQGYLAHNIVTYQNGNSPSTTTASCPSSESTQAPVTTSENTQDSSTTHSQLPMMSQAEWTKAINNSYNSYSTNTASYVNNVDSNNTTNQMKTVTNTKTVNSIDSNNASSSTVNVTNSTGAVVSSDSTANGQSLSNTKVTNEGSYNPVTTNDTTTVNAVDSFNTNSNNPTTTTTTSASNTTNTNNVTDTTNVANTTNTDNSVNNSDNNNSTKVDTTTITVPVNNDPHNPGNRP